MKVVSTKRRVCSILLSALLLVSMIPVSVFPATAVGAVITTNPTWDYADAGRGDGSIEITNYKGSGGAVVVPAEIDGLRVVGLGNAALYQKSITSLVISEGIEYLGDDAVMYNTEMTSMTLPSTLTTVGDNCFALAYGLTSVDLPQACINFVDDPAYDCALGGAKNNGLGIFYGLGYTFGFSTVTYHNQAVRAVLEEGNVTNAANSMPQYTLNYVEQSVEDPNWEYADSGRGDGTIEITGYKGAYGASVIVPATINGQKVVGVADLVAYDTGLTSIIVSEGIEYIGAYAFGWLPGQGQGTSIILPSTLTTLGHGAFVAPFYLNSITIPEACVNFPPAPQGVQPPNGVTLDAFFGAGFSSGGCTVTVYTQQARDFFVDLSNAMVAEAYPALNIVYEGEGEIPEEPQNPFTLTYDKNNPDGDITLVAYNGDDADVVVPTPFLCEYNDGSTVEKNVTFIGTGAFSAEPSMVTLSFNNAGGDAWRYAAPIFRSESVVDNPLLTTIDIPGGTRSFSTDNYPGNGQLVDNYLGYNDAIQRNPNLMNITVKDGNRFGLYSLDGLLVTYEMMADKRVTLIHFPEGRLGEQALDPSIKVIYTNAFINDSETMGDITGRTLYLDASSVETVYDYAFHGATALKSIDLRSCTSISPLAFDGFTTEQKAALTIKGYSNSYIETFANENGFAFEAIACSHASTHEEQKADGTPCQYNVICDTCGAVLEVVEHHGAYEIVTITTEPTCTTEGEAIAQCSVCGGGMVYDYVVPTIPHDYQTTTVPPTETEQGYDEHVCSMCGDSYRDNYTDPTGPVVIETEVNFVRRLQLHNQIYMNFGVMTDQFDAPISDVRMELQREKNGVLQQPVALSLDEAATNSSIYVYAYTDIAAAEMTDDMTIRFYFTMDGQQYVSQAHTVSIADYVISYLETSQDAATRTLMVDMLNYGAQTQLYFGYKTDELANAVLTPEQAAEGTQQTPEMANITQSQGEGIAIVNRLSLQSAVELSFGVSASDVTNAGATPDQLELHITREDTGETEVLQLTSDKAEGGYYIFQYTGLATAELGVKLTAQVYANGAPISVTRITSVESYLGGASQGDATYDLYVSLMKFSNAAKTVYGV